MNVTVFDYLPQVIGDTSVTVNYEIGNSLPLKFNVSDDNQIWYMFIRIMFYCILKIGHIILILM